MIVKNSVSDFGCALSSLKVSIDRKTQTNGLFPLGEMDCYLSFFQVEDRTCSQETISVAVTRFPMLTVHGV